MNSKLMDTGNDYPETCCKAHPLTILRANSRRTLKEYFKNLTDEEVEYLCERIGLSQAETEKVERDKGKFLTVWLRSGLNPRISNLLGLLEERQENGLVDHIKPYIVEDVKAHKRYLRSIEDQKHNSRIQTRRQSSSEYITVYDVDEEDGCSHFHVLFVGSENPRNDEIIDRLRKAGNKVCDLRTGRDLMPGVPTYPAGAIVIEQRAPTTLLMLDKDMLKDQGCCFQMFVAHNIDPDARCGRWIPVKLDADVEIPTFIKHGECLDLSTEEKLQENWDKLLCSIKGRNYDVDGASVLYALRI